MDAGTLQPRSLCFNAGAIAAWRATELDNDLKSSPEDEESDELISIDPRLGVYGDRPL